MNIYLMVDSEGISGIYTKEQVLLSESRINEGRRFMTDDINACMRGLKEAGVDKIYVRDCHGSSYTVIWNEISDDADYVVCGNTGDVRFAGIEECDAVILLGYHAMAGAAGAILEHSWSSKCIQNLWFNDKKVGEFEIDAAIAGELGKKVIMVSGDDKVCAEAKAIIPNIVTAEVKEGCSTFGGILLPPTKARELLRQKAKEAVQAYEKIEPYVIEGEIEMKVELVERCVLPKESAHPGLEHIDGRTYKVNADSVEKALFAAMVF